MSAPHLDCYDTISSNDKHYDDIDWSRINPPSVERYQSAVHTNLPRLFGELQNYSDPDYKSHQPAIDSICDKLLLVCTLLGSTA